MVIFRGHKSYKKIVFEEEITKIIIKAYIESKIFFPNFL